MNAERFWEKVLRTHGCWRWGGGVGGNGYGAFMWRDGEKRSTRPAHRVAYELSVGPIPDGLVIDHLCRNRLCVNPAHLEPVTAAENNRRAAAHLPSSCPKGHPYTSENTLRSPGTHGARVCRTCKVLRERDRRRRARGDAPGAGETMMQQGVSP